MLRNPVPVERLISYLRVSTREQGDSGLGLEAQRLKVAQLAAHRGAEVIAEFVEIESGRKLNRPKLAAAMELARKEGAAVVVAKLDRLARDAELVLRLSREAAANGMGGFLFCDLPDVDATTSAGRLILSVMASFAEFEARRISERTREALAVRVAEGKPLGGRLPPQAAINAARAAEAQVKAERLAEVIKPLRDQGLNLQETAEALTTAGVEAPGTSGCWHAKAVRRTLTRLGLD